MTHGERDAVIEEVAAMIEKAEVKIKHRLAQLRGDLLHGVAGFQFHATLEACDGDFT